MGFEMIDGIIIEIDDEGAPHFLLHVRGEQDSMPPLSEITLLAAYLRGVANALESAHGTVY